MASTKKPTASKGIYQLHVALLGSTPHNNWPLCLTGGNACPPEDVGGPGGFGDFVQSMSDPEADGHFENWTWHGGPFDPEGFDINTTNAMVDAEMTSHLWCRIQHDVSKAYGIASVDHDLLVRAQKATRGKLPALLKTWSTST